MRIEDATVEDIPAIRTLADRIWRVSFKTVISGEQIEYMLKVMYDPAVLRSQMKEGLQKYVLIHEEEQCAGFASYEVNHNQTNVTRLHKLFVLPELHKGGAGSLLLEHVIEQAREMNNESVLLSVNRQNPAVDFYQNRGFEIVDEDDIEIGNGFVLKDYVMALTLKA